MLSRRRQTRHLFHATLSPTSTNSGRSIPSHHVYSQANLSITLSHSTPSIICSSTAQPLSSSHEILKRQYASFTKTQKSSNNGSITRPKGRRCIRQQTEFPMGLGKFMGGFRASSKTDPRLDNSSDYPRPEIVMFNSGLDSNKYSNGSKTSKKNGQNNPEHPNPNLSFLEKQSPSIYQCSNQNSKSETWDSAEVSWPILGQIPRESSGFLAPAFETLPERQIDQKPIRVTIEPLLFAMSPLCSESGSAKSQSPMEDSDADSDENGEMTSVLGEDESDNEVLSNTLLAPIDIPGTKKSNMSIDDSNLLGSENFLFKLIPFSSNPCSS